MPDALGRHRLTDAARGRREAGRGVAGELLEAWASVGMSFDDSVEEVASLVGADVRAGLAASSASRPRLVEPFQASRRTRGRRRGGSPRPGEPFARLSSPCAGGSAGATRTDVVRTVTCLGADHAGAMRNRRLREDRVERAVEDVAGEALDDGMGTVEVDLAVADRQLEAGFQLVAIACATDRVADRRRRLLELDRHGVRPAHDRPVRRERLAHEPLHIDARSDGARASCQLAPDLFGPGSTAGRTACASASRARRPLPTRVCSSSLVVGGQRRA